MDFNDDVGYGPFFDSEVLVGLLERPLLRAMLDLREKAQRKTQQRVSEPLLGPRRKCGVLVVRGRALFSFEDISSHLGWWVCFEIHR